MNSTANQHLLDTFNNIRQQIEKLDIPARVYGDLSSEKKSYTLAEVGGEFGITHHKPSEEDSSDIFNWIHRHAQAEKLKYIALGVYTESSLGNNYSRLWLEHDIVPYVFSMNSSANKIHHHTVAHYIESLFNDLHIPYIEITNDRMIQPSILVTLDDYRKITEDDIMKQIETEAQAFVGKKAVFISATPQGGGVAIMRHALIRMYRLLGLDIQWHVLTENQDAFRVTKTKFHNILQGVSKKNMTLTKSDIELYETWITENAQILHEPLQNADVIVIDDPQPSGLIKHIRKERKDVPILYRSHIQLDTELINNPKTEAYNVWQYLWTNIQHADAFISHPIKEFVPDTVQDPHYMPPTTDPLDGLNKDLSEEHMNYYMKIFNEELLKSAQQPLDKSRPYFIQIARFDPSKGFPDVIEAFRLFREKLSAEMPDKEVPQLVIAGHRSVDDPDGDLIQTLIEKTLHKPTYDSIRDDVRCIKLPHIDQLFNTILRKSYLAYQLSYREGFEFKVSEALIKGKPVIVYNSGGIPLQVKDSQNGYVVDAGNLEDVAEKTFLLYTDEDLYKKMSLEATKAHRSEIFTTGNALNWLKLFNKHTL